MALELKEPLQTPIHRRSERISGSLRTASSVAGIVGDTAHSNHAEREKKILTCRECIIAEYGRLGKDGKLNLSNKALAAMVARVLSPEGRKTRDLIRSVYGDLPEQVLTKCVLEFLDAEEASNGFDPKRGGGNQIVMNALVHYEIRKNPFNSMNSIMEKYPTAFVPRSSGASLGPSESQLRSELDHAFFALKDSKGKPIYTSPKNTRRNVAEEGQYIITGMKDEAFSAGGIVVRVGEEGLYIFERKGYEPAIFSSSAGLTSLMVQYRIQNMRKVGEPYNPLDNGDVSFYGEHRPHWEEVEGAGGEMKEPLKPKERDALSVSQFMNTFRDRIYGMVASAEDIMQGAFDGMVQTLVNGVERSGIVNIFDRVNNKLLKLLEGDDQEIVARVDYLMNFIKTNFLTQDTHFGRVDTVQNLSTFTYMSSADPIVDIQYSVAINGEITIVVNRESPKLGKFTQLPHIIIPATATMEEAEALVINRLGQKISTPGESSENMTHSVVLENGPEKLSAWALKIIEIVKGFLGENIPVEQADELGVIYTPKQGSGPVTTVRFVLIYGGTQMQIAIYRDGLDRDYIVVREDMGEEEIRSLLENRLISHNNSVIGGSVGGTDLHSKGGLGWSDVSSFLFDGTLANRVLGTRREVGALLGLNNARVRYRDHTNGDDMSSDIGGTTHHNGNGEGAVGVDYDGGDRGLGVLERDRFQVAIGPNRRSWEIGSKKGREETHNGSNGNGDHNNGVEGINTGGSGLSLLGGNVIAIEREAPRWVTRAIDYTKTLLGNRFSMPTFDIPDGEVHEIEIVVGIHEPVLISRYMTSNDIRDAFIRAGIIRDPSPELTADLLKITTAVDPLDSLSRVVSEGGKNSGLLLGGERGSDLTTLFPSNEAGANGRGNTKVSKKALSILLNPDGTLREDKGKSYPQLVRMLSHSGDN